MRTSGSSVQALGRVNIHRIAWVAAVENSTAAPGAGPAAELGTASGELGGSCRAAASSLRALNVARGREGLGVPLHRALSWPLKAAKSQFLWPASLTPLRIYIPELVIEQALLPDSRGEDWSAGSAWK